MESILSANGHSTGSGGGYSDQARSSFGNSDDNSAEGEELDEEVAELDEELDELPDDD